MYWAIRTTLCSTLWLDAEQLPYQALMQPVRMLLMVQLQNFEDLGTHAKSFQSPEGEKVLSCPLCDCLGDVYTKELETFYPLHYSPVDVNGTSSGSVSRPWDG